MRRGVLVAMGDVEMVGAVGVVELGKSALESRQGEGG